MLAFEAVRACLNVHGQIALGHQIVPVKHIIGSEGRYSDFDRRFLPLTEAVEQRWRSIEHAMERLIDLPPVDLWKISDVYFVRDGNHRVSVARWMGQGHIDAYVTELLVDVPLTPDLSVRTLLFAEEYNDFLEWTNLHALRPDQRIEFSELGGYLELVRHINAYRYSLGRQLDRAIDRDEAVAGWYDMVYLPIVQVIREQHALKRFPGRTEADLYRWVMDNRAAIGEPADQTPEATRQRICHGAWAHQLVWLNCGCAARGVAEHWRRLTVSRGVVNLPIADCSRPVDRSTAHAADPLR